MSFRAGPLNRVIQEQINNKKSFSYSSLKSLKILFKEIINSTIQFEDSQPPRSTLILCFYSNGKEVFLISLTSLNQVPFS